VAQQGLLTLMKTGAFKHNHDVCHTLNQRTMRVHVYDGTTGLTIAVSAFLRNLFIIFALASPAVVYSAANSESERFDTFLEAIYQRTLSRSPMLSNRLNIGVPLAVDPVSSGWHFLTTYANGQTNDYRK